MRSGRWTDAVDSCRGGTLALVLAALHLAAAQIALQQYPIDWSSVHDEARPKNLQTGCPCSLLNGTCTPGCCCDSDCPQAAVASFQSAGACLAGSSLQQELAYCTDDGPFAKVSSKVPTGGQGLNR
jgi:hypothetical protein